MPAARPCAAFEPVSPDLDFAALVEATPNFEYVPRIHYETIDRQGIEAFERLVVLHVIRDGKPLVIEGYQERLEKWTFSAQWLKDNCSTKVERARNLTTKSDLPLTVGHYLNNMANLSNQWTAQNYRDPNRQRIYLKDIDCPQVWHDKLKEIIPPALFYLNSSTGEPGGPGADLEPDSHGYGMKQGRGIAKAGDLMSCLPAEMRAENLMCYIGHEGTYTPAHREMCASLGQNIMVETSTGFVENGTRTKPGSSIWFMTESKDRQVVSEYWLATLGHDIEVENHYAQINAWKAAPFKVHVVEQKVGDFILIPPLAPHQVWNRGTRTIKVAWNRTTAETLKMALDEALPRARMVCRDEQYKNKAIVYYALSKYSALLKSLDMQERKAANSEGTHQLVKGTKIWQLRRDFVILLGLYTRILISESFSSDNSDGNRIQFLPFDSNVTCAYCRCNIFNRFLTCPSCILETSNGEDNAYDICMECYAMGRSCACISKLKWVEQFNWDDLVQKYDTWRHQVIAFEGRVHEKSPQAFYIAKEQFGKKTLAQICDEELKRRPWTDITKPPRRELGGEEVAQVSDDVNVKKRKTIRRSEKWQREHGNCHICRHPEPKWKLATCHECGLVYCYGSLFRAFDILPQTVMEDTQWKCPKCMMICSCSTCRRDPEMKPFLPTGTMLGHDTSKVADPRSVESLVNFSISNVSWLKKAGDDHPHETKRLRKRQEEASKAKSRDPLLEDDYYELDTHVDQNESVEARSAAAQCKEFPLDPLLERKRGALGSLDSKSFAQQNSGMDHQPQLVSPDQLMDRQNIAEQFQHDVAEGIKFVYPDPDMPGHVGPPRSEPEPACVQHEYDTITATRGEKRRKGKSHHPSVSTTFIGDGYYRLDPSGKQREVDLPEAGKGDANATPSDDLGSLEVKSPSSKSKLVSFNSQSSRKSNGASRTTPRAEGKAEEVHITESDVRPVNLTLDEMQPQTLRTKAHLESDDEFLRWKDRKHRRKSSLTSQFSKSSTYIASDELSDDNDAMRPTAPGYSGIRGRPRGQYRWLRMGKESGNDGSPEDVSIVQIESELGISEINCPHTKLDGTKTDEGRGHQQLLAKKVGCPPHGKVMFEGQVAENRRAKLKAMRWVESCGNSLDNALGIEPDRLADHATNSAPKRPRPMFDTQKRPAKWASVDPWMRKKRDGTDRPSIVEGDTPSQQEVGSSQTARAKMQSSRGDSAHLLPSRSHDAGGSLGMRSTVRIKNAIRPSRGRGRMSRGGGAPRESGYGDQFSAR